MKSKQDKTGDHGILLDHQSRRHKLTLCISGHVSRTAVYALAVILLTLILVLANRPDLVAGVLGAAKWISSGK